MAHSDLLDKWRAALPVGEVVEDLLASLERVPRAVVMAPPGAGKSTLLPLELAGRLAEGMIIVLEPRRIAALQIAARMAEMLGESIGETVGYRVRFDKRVSPRTRIEVVTEGVFERMLVADATLDGIAAVVFDEFHERSLSSDLAFALTREAQQLIRPDLWIVVMSATIDSDALCRAIDAPLLESRGRCFDVKTVYCGDTDPKECTDLVVRTVARAHREQEGDILVFLPGQSEIERCVSMLEGRLGSTAVCPLYGQLSAAEQRRAIMPSSPGERKIVLATPVAETSLTIEGVRVVVDSGFCREPVFEPSSGLSRLSTVRISMDMARQRSGRAGRVADGVCYRLWSKATELRMKDSRSPEIETADLAPVLLEVAAWGGTEIFRLPWITPPAAGHLEQGSRLLRELGLISEDGKITALGRRVALLPCHPRVATMLVMAENDRLKALSADIAALLEEKDPLDDSAGVDINLRLAQLRSVRRRGVPGRWRRIIRVAEQYRRLVHAAEDNSAIIPAESGRLIASAYPERVAMRASDGRYRLAGGDYVVLQEDDSLADEEFLAIARTGKRIFLASPVDRSSVEAMGRWSLAVRWDSREGRALARRELRAGVLLLSIRMPDGDVHELVTKAVCEAAPKEGRTMFDFGRDEVQRIQMRLAALAEWHPELGIPDFSTDALLASAAVWLPMYIGKAQTVSELRKIDLCEVIWNSLTYEQQQAADRLAPERFMLPGGRRARISYRAGGLPPVLSARLEDCFGLAKTPSVDGGRCPVLMELLSPGFKPVQLTQDLEGFWQRTYFEVRSELRRRYPRHSWPDNPFEIPQRNNSKKG